MCTIKHMHMHMNMHVCMCMSCACVQHLKAVRSVSADYITYNQISKIKRPSYGPVCSEQCSVPARGSLESPTALPR